MSNVMLGKHVECNKFSPNIFNKTKCQNCFRPKEGHSAEALESNRASRRVSKCGYLFVAPDWDFSLSINRSKRWQRRWFILFDDGELTYSVDEHPDTIPQAIIDVNLVLEVSDAEEVTGNKYAIAITAPERVHFIKGTSQEESRRWFDVLSMFPRSMRGRQKRNATFPGIKATVNIIQTKEGNESISQTNGGSRTRYHSCQSDDKTAGLKENVPPSWAEDVIDGVNIKDIQSDLTHDKQCKKPDESLDIINKNINNKNHFENNNEAPAQKTRRYRQSRNSRSQRSKSDGVSKMFPLSLDRPKWVDDLDFNFDKSHNKLFQSNDTHHHSNRDTHSNEDKPSMRGVPDGCGYDTESRAHISLCSNFIHDMSTEDGITTQKGWLMKLDSNQEWSRHWFVLKEPAFMFYRDASCEEKGILDGFIDLCLIQKIESAELSKYHGFRITTWDGHSYTFSVGSMALRNSWINALSQASNPNSKAKIIDSNAPPKIANEDNQSPIKKNKGNPLETVPGPQAPSRQVKNNKSVDGSGLNSKWNDQLDRPISKGNSIIMLDKALPPSPPVTRTPISRVKDKARSRSSSRSRASRKSKTVSSPVLYSDDADGSTSDNQNIDAKHIHSNSRLSNTDKQRMSNGDIVLVELLETEVESLRTRLEAAQNELVLLHQENLNLQNNSNCLKMKNNNWNEGCASEECSSIIQSLSDECQRLRNDGNTLREDVDKLMNENSKLKKDQEELPRIREDIADLKSQCNWKEIVIQRQRLETQSLKNNLETGKEEINSLFNKLTKFSKDKLVLTKEIHDLEAKLEVHENPQKEPALVIMEDFDKEAEFDNAKIQLTKAQSDIRSFKKELRHAHCLYDELELHTMKMKHDMDAVKQENQSDSRMMAERIEDLTSKLSSAERATRQLKQKLVKAENRQERRSRSLRGGKESLTISKEMEAKLSELENKMKVFEGFVPSDDLPPSSAQNDAEKSDSASIFLRLNMLNSKVSSAADHIEREKVMEIPTKENSNQSIPNMIPDSKSLDSNSENVIQQLKMRLKYIENIMDACKKRISEVMQRILLVDCQCMSKVNLAELKEDLETIYEVILGQFSSSNGARNASQLCHAVSKMQKLLHGQSQQICNQRRKLKVAGLHTIEVERKLMAEKLALETVIMKYMSCVIHSPEHKENTVAFWTCELQILSENMEYIKNITSGSDQNDLFLTMKRVLKSILSSPVQNNMDSVSKTIYSTSNSSVEDALDQVHTSDDLKSNFESLRTKFVEITTFIDEQFSTKVHAIIKSFFNNHENDINILSDSNQNVKKLLNTLKFHESWDAAREMVNEGIVKSEMQMLMCKLSCIYRDCINDQSTSSACWCLTEFQNVLLSRKQSGILNHLDDEITKAVGLFVPEISRMMSNWTFLSSNVSKQTCDLLEESVALVSFKAILTGHFSAINAFIFGSFSADYFEVQNEESVTENTERLIQSILTNAELSFILNQAQLNNSEETNHESQINVTDLKDSYENMLQYERDMFVNVLDNLQSQVAEVKSKSSCKSPCLKCQQNNESLQKLMKEHQLEMIAIKGKYEDEMKCLEVKYKDLLAVKGNESACDKNNLQRQVNTLTRQLKSLEDQYDKQMENLRINFEKELSQRLTSKISDDFHRQQYEAEIEQLKELCKMGFNAMEKCHKHVVKDLENKHKAKIESLQFEKEQALADETRATMAALEAIKRAHEEEIQKELAKVKEELAFNPSNRSHASPGSVKSNELDEIKNEIRSISERMSSSKMDESILKEKVDSLTEQLVDANSQIFELKARNSQLNNYVTCKTDEMRETANETKDSKQFQRLLEINQGELLRKNEELAEMRNELETLKIRESQLTGQCSQLQENLKVKKKVKEDEMKNFLSKLEAVSSENEATLSSLRFFPTASESRNIEISEVKPRKPLKLFFNYKRDAKSTVGIIDDASTLKSDV